MFYFSPFSDKNECDEDDICVDGKYCVNSKGSYQCKGQWKLW